MRWPLRLLILLIGIAGSGVFPWPSSQRHQAVGAVSPEALAHPASAFTPKQLEVAFPNLPSFDGMVHLTHAGDGTNRLWLVLQAGRILVFPNAAGVSSAKVFLDIQSRVSTEVLVDRLYKQIGQRKVERDFLHERSER